MLRKSHACICTHLILWPQRKHIPRAARPTHLPSRIQRIDNWTIQYLLCIRCLSTPRLPRLLLVQIHVRIVVIIVFCITTVAISIPCPRFVRRVGSSEDDAHSARRRTPTSTTRECVHIAGVLIKDVSLQSCKARRIFMNRPGHDCDEG